MSTRIRYSSSDLGDALKKSKKVFKAGKKSFYVVLNENSMHFIIFDADSKEVVVSGGNTTNKTVLRLQAKKALEQLGVKFAGESRKNSRLAAAAASQTSQPETKPTTLVSRGEFMDMIEVKLKELLSLVQMTKAPTREAQNETVAS